MTTQSMRQRRLLSSARRAGLQIDYQAAMGRTPRHAQGYADIHMRPAPGRFLRNAVLYGAFGWMVVGLLTWCVSLLAV
jgi:hypothetical protein